MQDLAHIVRSFCARHSIALNTDLGQHFLIDPSVLDRILEVAHVEATDTVVEIGMGLGILTKELVSRAKKVLAVELDARWIPLAEEYVGEPGRRHLEIVHDNALHVEFPREPYKIVANIPYHITSPLLRHAFLESKQPPRSLTLLIQREVAEKICDTQDRGVLTIMVGLFGTPTLVMNVPPSSFLPPPKVDSAVLHIACFEHPRVDERTLDMLLKLLKHGFAQRRKMLSNSIGKLPGGPEALQKASIDPNRRPQTLSVEEWIALAHATAASA